MSLPLLRSDSAVYEIKTAAELEALFAEELVVIFKHSPTCPVSWMAHHQVTSFRSSRPEVPVYLLSVRKYRDISNEVARRTGVRHESPQVLVLKGGNLLGSASHDGVTSELLHELIVRSIA